MEASERLGGQGVPPTPLELRTNNSERDEGWWGIEVPCCIQADLKLLRRLVAYDIWEESHVSAACQPVSLHNG